MDKPSSLFREALGILQSLPWVVLIAYLLNEALQGPADLFLLFLFAAAKIYLFGGIFASLIEVASGEVVVLKAGKLWTNAARHSLVYFLLILLPFLIHAALARMLPFSLAVPAKTFAAHADLLVFYLLIRHLTRVKYGDRLRPVFRNHSINLKTLGILLALHAVQMVLFYASQELPPGGVVASLARFVSIYVHLFLFVFMAVCLLKRHPRIASSFTYEKELFLISTAAGKVVNSLIYTATSRRRPAFFFILRALTPSSYMVREFAQVTWHNRYYKGGVLVAINCCTANAPEAYKIAREFRRRGSTVVMGGPHVSFMTDEALEYCDSVVVGECEALWPEVIEDHENNRLKKVYRGVPLEDYFSVVFGTLLNAPASDVRGLIETSRGCKFHCDFCSVPSITPGRVRTAPVEKVAALIKAKAPRHSLVMFNDNNIYNDPAYAARLFAALKPLKIRWASFCTLDIAKNAKALRAAKDSGCSYLSLGLESSCSEKAPLRRGKLALADRYLHYTRKIRKAGIRFGTSYIFGFDEDSAGSLLSLWKLSLRIRPEIIGFSILTPMPGTRFFDAAVAENRLTNLNWDKYSGSNLVFRHKNLSDFMLSKVYYPFIPVLFFLTTAWVGQVVLLILCVCLAALFGESRTSSLLLSF